MAKKRFHIGAVLSVTHDRLVAPNGIEDVYAILNHMTGDNLYTHQLPRAMRECKPWLLRQHPGLVNVDASNVDHENWREWLAKIVREHGEYLDIEPIPADDHERIDPVQELVGMVGADRVVVVQPYAKDQ